MKKSEFSFYELIKLVRVNNLLIIALTQYFTAIFLIGPKEQWKNIILNPGLFLVSLATVCLAAAGYIINDYYDIKIDTINRPGRVVVGKTLKRRRALFAHFFFNLVALSIAVFISPKIFLLMLFISFLLWLYSNQLKRLPLIGNLSIALLTGLALTLVGVYFGKHLFLVNTYAVFAFFIALVREIIKDMEDVRGDESFGSKTLPIIWGIRKSKQFIYLIVVFSVFILFFLAYLINNIMLFYYFIFMLVPYFIFIFMLINADTRKDFSDLSTFLKGVMITGVLSMILF